MFAATGFFHASEAMRTDSVACNQDRGGFLGGAGSTLQVSLTTPPAGEYSYACRELGQVYTVRSTGSIIVVLEPTGQAPPRR